MSLRKRTPDRVFQTVIPLHKNLAMGTLSSILRQCGISHEEFIKKFD